jgi:hypothetical protein
MFLGDNISAFQFDLEEVSLDEIFLPSGKTFSLNSLESISDKSEIIIDHQNEIIYGLDSFLLSIKEGKSRVWVKRQKKYSKFDLPLYSMAG